MVLPPPPTRFLETICFSGHKILFFMVTIEIQMSVPEIVGAELFVFSRCVTNLCWKFGFCPLTIFSTDKDPPEGGEKGNRWQSETINSLCFFSCVLDIITITERCHQEREAEEREEAGNSARCPESESEVLHSNYIIPCPPSHYKQQSLQSHHQDNEMRARIYFRLTCNCDLTLTTGKYSGILQPEKS